jgi:hypothetical protein
VATREQNEQKFKNWILLPDGGRRYWYDIAGRCGYRARYVKIVDATEKTLRFYQEIFDPTGKLISLHEKYPHDLGHLHLKDM